MRDIIKAVIDLKYALEKNGINAGSLELTLSADGFRSFEHSCWNSDEILFTGTPSVCTIVGVPIKARPETIEEKTDAVCAKIAGGRLSIPKKPEPHSYTVVA